MKLPVLSIILTFIVLQQVLSACRKRKRQTTRKTILQTILHYLAEWKLIKYRQSYRRNQSGTCKYFPINNYNFSDDRSKGKMNGHTVMNSVSGALGVRKTIK